MQAHVSPVTRGAAKDEVTHRHFYAFSTSEASPQASPQAEEIPRNPWLLHQAMVDQSCQILRTLRTPGLPFLLPFFLDPMPTPSVPRLSISLARNPVAAHNLEPNKKTKSTYLSTH